MRRKKNKTLGDVFNTLTEDEQTFVYLLLGKAAESHSTNILDEDDKKILDTFNNEQKMIVNILINFAAKEDSNDGKGKD